MDFAELEKDTASRDEWLLMCRKQNVFSQMILIKDDIHYGQINSDFLQTTFFPFATFLFLKKNLESAFHITWMMNLLGNQRLISLPRRHDQHMACHSSIFFTNRW